MEPLESDRGMIAHGGMHLTENASIILGTVIIEKCIKITKKLEIQATRIATPVTVTICNDVTEHQDPTPAQSQATDTV